MKIIATILAAGALIFTGSAASAENAAGGEAKRARLLEGRGAGEPTRCISGVRGNKVDVIEHVGVVYDAGETIYVARATNPEALRRSDALVLERGSSSRLCTDDVRLAIDRHQGNVTGPVFLSDFIPYQRADRALIGALPSSVLQIARGSG